MMETVISKIEKAIKWPAKQWVGNCYAVSAKIFKAKLVPRKSHVRYGMFWGEIDDESRFSGRPMTQHGWIELPDGRIYDPTRWVFENKPPYIWIGEDFGNEYDIAAQKMNGAFYKDFPAATGKPFKLTKSQRRVLCKFAPSLAQNDPDFGQLMWLAHLSFEVMGDDAKAVYTIFREIGQEAMVPLDARRHVLENDRVY